MIAKVKHKGENGVHDSKSKIEQVIIADTERSNDSIQKGREKYWVPDLFLEHKHRSVLCTARGWPAGQPLDDTIIKASQRLLHCQFPQFKGLQPTLYSKALHKFQEHPEGSVAFKFTTLKEGSVAFKFTTLYSKALHKFQEHPEGSVAFKFTTLVPLTGLLALLLDDPDVQWPVLIYGQQICWK